MSIDTSAVFAYGARIPDMDLDELDKKLGAMNTEVGYATAGRYDYPDTYLVTFCETADLGKPERIPGDALHPVQIPHWDAQIRAAAEALGVELCAEPGWFLAADQS